MSSTRVNKSFVSSSSAVLPLKLGEEVTPNMMEGNKQGIVSILGCDSQLPKSHAASFRRTLSADMSSKTWLAQNGFTKSPTLKKVASFQQLPIISPLDSSSSDEGEGESEDEIFSRKQKQGEGVWSSILSQSKATSQELPPPYVHPLAKKSRSSLKGKSLEVCTESLGSETGSEGFPSYPPSEAGSEEEISQQEEKEHVQQNKFDSEEISSVAKYDYSAATSKKVVQPRSFPPPIPSLTRSNDDNGPSLQMHSHRVNGRLVVEAVTVPSTKKFHAQRQDGRLRLTLRNTHSDQEQAEQIDDEKVVVDQNKDEVEDLEEIFEDGEENEVETDDDEEEMTDEEVESDLYGSKTMGIVMDQAVPRMTDSSVNVHRSAFMMKKLMGVENQNPKWSHKFNYSVPAQLVQVHAANEETTLSPKSLPPRHPVARLIPGSPAAAPASFNSYEYFWRAKPAMASLKNQFIHHDTPSNRIYASTKKPEAYKKHESLLLRNCKETRTILSWEQYCIATS